MQQSLSVNGPLNEVWLSHESKVAYGISLGSKRGSIAFGMERNRLSISALQNKTTQLRLRLFDRKVKLMMSLW